jgi:hypothetical protein
VRFTRCARRFPLRLTSGAFILNSGLSKRNVDEATAKQLHGFAVGTYPVLTRVEPQRFVQLVSAGEVAIGAALLLPVVPAAVAGAGLTAFGGSTLGLYLRTPGMREEGSLRPTERGLPIAKDVWLLGMGLSLLVDGLLERKKRS